MLRTSIARALYPVPDGVFLVSLNVSEKLPVVAETVPDNAPTKLVVVKVLVLPV